MTCASSNGLVWRETKATEQETRRKSPYERHVRKSNTALCGNQGSPQPGAPRSHRAGHTGINSHRSGAILRPAMTQSRSRRKGEKDSETGLRVRLDSRVASPLRVHSVDLFLASSSLEGDSQCYRSGYCWVGKACVAQCSSEEVPEPLSVRGNSRTAFWASLTS